MYTAQKLKVKIMRLKRPMVKLESSVHKVERSIARNGKR